MFGAAEEAAAAADGETADEVEENLELALDDAGEEEIPDLALDIDTGEGEEGIPDLALDIGGEESSDELPDLGIDGLDLGEGSPVAEEGTSDEPAGEPDDDDINALLAMLDNDIDDEPLEQPEEEEEIPEEEEEGPVDIQIDPDQLFSIDETDEIFADEISDEPEPEPEEEEVTDDFDVDLNPEPDEDEMQSDDEPFALLDDGEEDGGMTEEPDEGQESEEDEPVATLEVAKPVKRKKVKRKKAKKKEEASFFKRIFGNIVTEQTAEIEAKEREMEGMSKEEKTKLKAEQKKLQAAEKEEKAQVAAQEKEKKNADKAAAAAEKAAKKEEKKKQKAELAATEVVGKVNPIGTTIVLLLFAFICVSVLLGSNTFSYRSALLNTKKSFDEGEVEDAYKSIRGVKVSEEDMETKEKVYICMQLQKQLNSYEHYYDMGMYLESLDSLMKGIRSYDANKDKADKYEILGQINALEGKIAGNLYTEFGVSETEAREMNAIEDRHQYTLELEKIIEQWNEKNKEDER